MSPFITISFVFLLPCRCSKGDKPFFQKAKYEIHFGCRYWRGFRGFAGWLRRLSSIETLDDNGCFADETTATSGMLSRAESSMFKDFVSALVWIC